GARFRSSSSAAPYPLVARALSGVPVDVSRLLGVPELPEVEALAAYLRERAAGHAVSRAEVAAISVLKTFDPPVTALTGKKIVGASRRGKYLQIALEDDLLLITHLARA